MDASRVSALPKVREALVALQLGFQQLPGLVADGRDMGTVIFPGAQLKVYLIASAECRAERRYKQLISKGISANITALRADLEARDARDMSQRGAAQACTSQVPASPPVRWRAWSCRGTKRLVQA